MCFLECISRPLHSSRSYYLKKFRTSNQAQRKMCSKSRNPVNIQLILEALTVYGRPLAMRASSAFLFHIRTPQNKLKWKGLVSSSNDLNRYSNFLFCLPFSKVNRYLKELVGRKILDLLENSCRKSNFVCSQRCNQNIVVRFCSSSCI